MFFFLSEVPVHSVNLEERIGSQLRSRLDLNTGAKLEGWMEDLIKSSFIDLLDLSRLDPPCAGPGGNISS